MKIVTLDEMKIEFSDLNMEEDSKWKYGVILFNPIKSNWKRMDYSINDRIYYFYSSNKFFNPRMSGMSLYSSCLNGHDENIELNYYMNNWIPDLCMILDQDELDNFIADPSGSIIKMLSDYYGLK